MVEIKNIRNCVSERRIGHVRISEYLLHEIENEAVLKMFQTIGVVLRVEYWEYSQMYKYTISNPNLRALRDGEEIPEYLVSLHRKENKEITMEMTEIVKKQTFPPERKFKNIEHDDVYVMKNEAGINCTNDNEGSVMVEYYHENDVSKHYPFYRNRDEFYEKFEEIFDEKDQDSNLG